MITKFKLFENNKYKYSDITYLIKDIAKSDGIKKKIKIKKLLNIFDNNEIDINTINKFSYNFLFSIIFNNAYDLLKIILNKYNININQQSHKKKTPLIFTAYKYKLKNREEILNILIEHNADWTIKDDKNKDFLDYLNDALKQKIIKKYPKHYEQYLRYKNLNKFNI